MLKLKFNRGFTLIELILVIAIIGVLSAVAIPKYINLTGNAQTNATRSIAGALSSANATNYAARVVSKSNGGAVTNCTSVANLLQGGLPSGYTITSLAATANNTVTCTLNGPSSTSATFYATGIS